MRRLIYLLFILLALTGAQAAPASETNRNDTAVKPWSVDLRVKNYFNSHTSYEFGNPNSPYQAPLSRLEFPLNTWWAGAEVRRSFPRASAGLEVLRNVSGEADGTFKDSDWDDNAKPNVKTIYSELNCRMEPSYAVRGDLDLKVSDWIGLPAWLDLRPVIGFRWQRFTLVAHDGTQSYPAPGDNRPSQSLPGDAIRFEQTYWQYFLGVRTAFEIGKHVNVSQLKLLMQLDWAYVEGSNEDHHLLKVNRFTYDKTQGDAWHASIGLKTGLTANLNANLEADYLKIQTTGSHRMVNGVPATHTSWNYGVKVWSEQTSLMMSLEYSF